jgi:16S rRNA C1402 (ribose-2'-O) methylase RsmI
MSKTLRDIVKEIQFAKDWTIEQVAKSIGYSRVHLTKEMAKGDNNELKTLLIDHHREILQNVSKGNIRLTIGKDEFQQMILEEIRQLKATANVVKLTAAKIAAKVNSSNIKEEYQMLLKLIDAEADRLLELDKKKYGVKPPGS